MIIRRASYEDYSAIYDLVKTAFETARVSSGTEQDFVLELRAGENFLPALEFVAEEDGLLIGHIMLTKQTVQTEKGDFTGVLVAPLCVSLSRRDQGIGGRLMRYACAQAADHGFTAAFLVGNPVYYARFGYRCVTDFGIQNASDIPDEFVQGCELVPHALQAIRGSIRIV